MKDTILEVKRLKIAFRTQAGTLKAVRDISFDLERGRTLAIVGESGSGKSVTSRAVMGILAGNAIVEGGEIFYDGKDLLRIAEEDMQKIRGDKISMIFQDPLSSLNPIVKIGKQITEAMLLKSKTGRRESARSYKRLLALLRKTAQESAAAQKERVDSLFDTFTAFCTEGTRLENAYNNASVHAQELAALIDDFLFKAEKKQNLDVKQTLREYSSRMRRMRDPLLTEGYDQELGSLSAEVDKAASSAGKATAERLVPADILALLRRVRALLEKINTRPRPDFMAIGYARTRHPGETLTPVQASQALEKEFMGEFLPLLDDTVRFSMDRSIAAKKALLPRLREAQTWYAGDFARKEGLARARGLTREVEASIDRLEVVKDSAAYAFGSSLTNAIEQYFSCKERNPREEARFARQNARRERLIARGRNVTWKVVPANVYDLDDLRGNINTVVTRLADRYEADVENASRVDIRARSNALVGALRAYSSQMVARLTKRMARERAIKLMEEVGIHEPRQRFYQYPFEFSGGMRQRIVIAIALAADPDILICDEPTTALDVTIQAQILELINRLKAERNFSVIFITHDLGVVANMADDIAVMYAGRIVEYGTADDIFYDPRHPYTWALLSSMPDLDTKEKLEAIPGTPPNMIYPPKGDAFADRNRYAMAIDFEQQPPMFPVSQTHSAATWLLHPDAPKVEVPKIITYRIARMRAKEAIQEGGAAHAE